MLALALLDETCSRKAFNSWNDSHLSAPGFHFPRSHNGFGVVVASLDDYVWPYVDDQPKRGWIIENDDRVYRGECSEHTGTRRFIHDWAVRPFEIGYGAVAIDGNDEPVSKLARLFDHTDVPDVQEIESTIGEHNALTVLLP
jgi:hypothetical protein